MPFDYLIVAAGSTTNYFGIPGADDFAFPLYTLEDAVRLRNHLLSLFEAADAVPALVDDGVLNFVVVGGGPTGVEVAGAMAELVDKVLSQDFHDLDVHRTRIILSSRRRSLLGAFSEQLAALRPAHPRSPRGRGAHWRRGRVASPRTQITLDTGEVIPHPQPGVGRRRAGR